jgi:hypothetical protein
MVDVPGWMKTAWTFVCYASHRAERMVLREFMLEKHFS